VLSWAAGTAASLVFVNYPNIFPSVTRGLNQPLIDALHGADLSGLISAGVAALCFLILRRALR
jgi:hypothetical protein